RRGPPELSEGSLARPSENRIGFHCYRLPRELCAQPKTRRRRFLPRLPFSRSVLGAASLCFLAGAGFGSWDFVDCCAPLSAVSLAAADGLAPRPLPPRLFLPEALASAAASPAASPWAPPARAAAELAERRPVANSASIPPSRGVLSFRGGLLGSTCSSASVSGISISAGIRSICRCVGLAAKI